MAERTPNPYLTILGARLRSQATYRGSLWTDLVSSVAVGFVEFLEVLVIFGNVDVLGGLSFHETLLVFGLANLAWSLSQFVCGDLDNLGELVRTGELTSRFARPLPIVAQMMTNDFNLRRLVRIVVGIGVLAYALPQLPIAWTPGNVWLLVSAVIFGTLILGSLFVLAAGTQFFLVDASEMTNAFTYSTNYASQQSAAVFPGWLRAAFLYVLPASFIAYLPTIAVLGIDGPPMAPAWLAWWLPAVAALFTAASLKVWAWGLRHYQGAGG